MRVDRYWKQDKQLATFCAALSVDETHTETGFGRLTLSDPQKHVTCLDCVTLLCIALLVTIVEKTAHVQAS